MDFDTLYRKFGPRIQRLARQTVIDSHLAEDVMQETLLRVHRYQKKLDPQRPLWPWFAAIVRNACVDVLSRARSTTEDLCPTVEEEGCRAGPALSDPEVRRGMNERDRLILDALASLNPRHQRVLTLKHREGWRYKDIALLEGTTVDASQAALRRARENFRAAYVTLARERGFDEKPFTKRKDGSVIGGFLVPGFFTQTFIRLRNKLREMNWRLGQLLNDSGMPFLPMLGGKIDSAIAIGIAIAIGLGGVAPTTASPSTEIPITMAGSPEIQMIARQHQVASSPKDASASPFAPSDMIGTVEHYADELDLNPTKEETPEDTNMATLVASPNYENDHTVFATGCSRVTPIGASKCGLVFVTRDGGASWVKLPAVGHLDSWAFMFPSTYPEDNRIFSANSIGLQESADGGNSFYPILPISLNSAAISPNFGRGDSLFVLSTPTGIMEYQRDLNTLKPSSLLLPKDATFGSLGVSPSPTDPVTLVSTFRRQQRDDFYYEDEYFPYRCQGAVCQKVDSYQISSPKYRFSPKFIEDGTVYIYSPRNLYVSSDRGRNFRKLSIPEPAFGHYFSCCNNLAVLPSTSSSTSALVAAALDSLGGVYRSSDGGNSWLPSKIDLPGFHWSTTQLVATPTGRLFAAGNNGGIACSADGGVTWARRCPPEPY